MIDFLRSSKAHVFVDELADVIEITGEDHHHLSRVLRIQKGDVISAANNGIIRKYLVDNVDSLKIALKADGDFVKGNESEVIVAVSLFKLDRLEWGIAKAVELGVTKIIVGQTRRSTLKLNEKSKNKFEIRTASIVRNAAMQSRRTNLPEVKVVSDLFGYLKESKASLVLCDPSGSKAVETEGKTIVIGPEGGFDSAEVEGLGSKTRLWSISPSILRAETAIAFATGLACLNSEAN